MGAGSAIAFPPGVVFGERLISIGAKTMIGPYVTLAVGMGPDEPLQVPGGIVISIGDRCMIGRGVSLVGRRRIVIEDDVTFAPDIYVTDHNHAYNDLRIPIGRQWLAEDEVRIGAGSWIGTGVVVLPGADIGRHVAIAAGSVVRGTIPDYSVVAGVPAGRAPLRRGRGVGATVADRGAHAGLVDRRRRGRDDDAARLVRPPRALTWTQAASTSTNAGVRVAVTVALVRNRTLSRTTYWTIHTVPNPARLASMATAVRPAVPAWADVAIPVAMLTASVDSPSPAKVSAK